MTNTFETGKTYWTRSMCDYDCIISLTVTARTNKTITNNAGKKFRVFIDHEGSEAVRPWGNYSMAPIVNAARVAA